MNFLISLKNKILSGLLGSTSIFFVGLGLMSGVYSPIAQARDPVVCQADMPGGINFGVVNTLQTTNSDVSSNLNISCKNYTNTNYYVTVCFNIGEGANPLISGNRSMLSGGNNLSYQLYSDAARTQIWGSVNSTNYPTPVRLDFYLARKKTYSQTITTYGRLFGNQTTAPVGIYQDSYTNPQVRITGVLTYSYGSGSCDQFGSDAGLFSTFNVTANVQSNCLVSASTLNFGTTSLLSAAVSSTSTVGVQCTNNVPYQVGLSYGTNPVGNVRYMTSGTNSISYNLYQDTNHTTPWTNTNQESGVGTGLNTNKTVFGLVPAQPTAKAGVYQDTVQVNVSY